MSQTIDKNEIFNQIDEFNEHIINEVETKTKRFFYVEADIAQDRAEFFGFVLKKYFNNKKEFKKIIDLTFGSGNLVSHIILDNDIKYENLILNDKETNNTNQNILLKNITLENKDILIKPFEDSFDLIVFNPPIGNKSVANRIELSKSTKNTEKIISQIQKLIKEDNIFIFYGEEKHYKDFFDGLNYIRYITDDEGKDLFIISKQFTQNICYEKQNNDFIENKECKKTSKINITKDYNLEALAKQINDSFSQLKSVGSIWGAEDNKDKDIEQNVSNQSNSKPKKKFKNFLYKGKK